MTEKFNLDVAFNKAYNSSVSGMIAMGSQVTGLMWLRTSVNDQYKYGGSLKTSFRKLYQEGGLRRFYRGYSFALLQAPLSRFGDIAGYSMISQYSESNPMPLPIQTALGSLWSGFWRFNLMPIDTCKTMLQVQGKNGLQEVKNKVNTHGVRSLYHGYLGTVGATMIGYYPWFFTFGYLDKKLEKSDHYLDNLCRNAGIGFLSSFASDTCSNIARVLKTTKQTTYQDISYRQHANNIIKQEGLFGLATRGLGTKIISNGLQSATFTVLWKYIEHIREDKKGDNNVA